MRALSKILLIVFLLFLISPVQSQNIPPYKNPKLPVEQRISDLLSRMTLEEKSAQLISFMENPGSSLFDNKGKFDPGRAATYLKNGMGEISHASGMRGPRETAEPGQMQKVEFTLGPNELSFMNVEIQRVVEPGSFKIMAGGNFADLIESTLNVK